MQPLPEKPRITYPCRWEYRIIGRDENTLRDVVAAVVAGREYRVEVSNTSSGGKYVCLVLGLTVNDEEERVGLFVSLRERPEIVIVL
jgi:hypothetical protein